MRELFEDKFGEYNVNLAVTGQQFEYPFFKDLGYKMIETASSSLSNPKIDDVDIEILSLLSQNSRESTIFLASKLKMTEKTIRERIKKLEKNKFITSYSVQLHPGRVGYYFYIVLIRVKKNKEEIEKFAKSIPETFYIVNGVGFFDLQLEFYCNTEDRIYNIEEELFEKFSSEISQLDILYVKKEYSVNYFVKSMKNYLKNIN